MMQPVQNDTTAHSGSCCMAEKYGGWCRDLHAYDVGGKEYCVFHAPQGEKQVDINGTYKDLSPKEFNKLVFERIDSAKGKNTPCNLAGTVFEGDIDFSRYGKDKLLPEITFSGAVFSGEADFYRITFSGEAYFIKTAFSGEASFIEATFSGKAYFSGAAFSGEADFSGAAFRTEAYFSGADFSGKAYFSGIAFRGDAYFSGADLSGKAYFIETTFSGKAYFIETTFSGKADFIEATFSGKATFLDLTVSGKIEFEGVNLEKVSFIDTDLRDVDFVNCTWPAKRGRDILYDENAVLEKYKQGYFDLLFDEFKQALKNKDTKLWTFLKQTEKKHKAFKNEIRKVEILYRRLKQKYRDEHDWPEVSNWHYGEKEMCRSRRGSRFRRYFPLSLSNLYWFSSGYAERPVRAGLFMLALIFGISGLMELTAFVPAKEAPIWITDLKGIWKMIGYGFSTLQYITFHKEPVFVPSSLLGGGLTLVARIAVPIQVAFVVMAARNRFRR